MQFSVERWGDGEWSLVGPVVDASGARQAVARAASQEGLYRVNPAGTRGFNEAFVVPGWGAPTRVPERLNGDGSLASSRGATFEAIREAVTVAGIRAQHGRARAIENQACAARLRASSAAMRRLRATTVGH